MRTIILAAATAFSLMLPSAAFADEYNFTVPVRIENAFNVSGGAVACAVRFREGDRYVVDEGSTHIALTNNGYVGNVAVRVTTVRPRASQELWSCNLALYYGATEALPQTSAASVAEWYRNRSGHNVESMNLMVQGNRLP